MAHIYLGAAPGDENPARRVVALKALKGAMAMNLEYSSMFTEEAKVMERLDHPNIVKVVELAAEGTQLFIALEVLQGQTLWNLWRLCREREVRLRYDLIAYIGARIAAALHAAHELRHDRTGELQHIVHRDVNPTNIFLTYDGGVKLLDFGLVGARAVHGRSMLRGKLGYMAPEQAQDGAVDRRADVFALAVTLWELSTDRRLFRVEDDDETLARVLRAEVPSATGLVEGYPPALWAILKRGLALRPEDRQQSAAEMQQELEDFLLSQGNPNGEQIVAAVLGALFADDKTLQAQWLQEALDLPAPSVRPSLQMAAPSLDDLASVPALPPPSSAQLPPIEPAPNSLPLGDFAPPSMYLSGEHVRMPSSEWRFISTRSLPDSEDMAPESGPPAALAPQALAERRSEPPAAIAEAVAVARKLPRWALPVAALAVIGLGWLLLR